MAMLRDQNLLAFITSYEGYFYLVDISYAGIENGSDPKKVPLVKLNIRIPHEQIKNFDIDFSMGQLLLGTSGGNVYMYDLPKALENERVLAGKKLEMGVEEELVYTYLQRVHMNELNEYLTNQTNGKRQDIASTINEHIAMGPQTLNQPTMEFN